MDSGGERDENPSVNLISRDRASEADSGVVSIDGERTWRMTLFQESMEAQEPTEHSEGEGKKRTGKAWCQGRKRRGGWEGEGWGASVLSPLPSCPQDREQLWKSAS